jgi:hypothetical protein
MHHISTQQPQSHEVQPHVTLFVFAFYILFCKSLEMMWSDNIHTSSPTYIMCSVNISSLRLYHLLEESQM